MNRLLLAALLALASSSALAAPTVDCTWTVKGTLRVDHTLAELDDTLGDISLLDGVTIKVSSKARTLGAWAPYWTKWDEVETNSRGEFSVSKDKGCDGVRRFKIEAKFENDDLQIRHRSIANQAKWYTLVHHDDEEITNHTFEIERTFGPGRVQDLDDPDARAHADMWVVYSMLIDELNSYGPSMGFTKRLEVKYPSNTLAGDDAEASYADPIREIAFIFRENACPDNVFPTSGCEDHFNTPTLLHEAMHIWVYQHATGEDELALNLLTSGSTHCFEPPHIAFHEGFAEFAAERLGYKLFRTRLPQPVRRDVLVEGVQCEGDVHQMPTLSKVEEHDYGWVHALRVLVKNDLHRFTFAGEASNTVFNTHWNGSGVLNEIERHGQVLARASCEAPQVDFADVLRTFLTSPVNGYTSPLAKSDMNLDDFVDRLADVNSLGNTTRDAFLTLIDPAAREEPVDLFCDLPDRPAVQVERAPVVPQRRTIRGN